MSVALMVRLSSYARLFILNHAPRNPALNPTALCYASVDDRSHDKGSEPFSDTRFRSADF